METPRFRSPSAVMSNPPNSPVPVVVCSSSWRPQASSKHLLFLKDKFCSLSGGWALTPVYRVGFEYYRTTGAARAKVTVSAGFHDNDGCSRVTLSAKPKSYMYSRVHVE